MSTVRDLLGALYPGGPGPGDDGCHVLVEFKSGFEPNGRASETWEFYCVLTLPDHEQHWKNNKGQYVKCTTRAPFSVKRRTLDECIASAIDFLKSEKINMLEHAWQEKDQGDE